MAQFQKPSVSEENIEERYHRYLRYFSLSKGQLRQSYRTLLNEFSHGLEMHKSSPNLWLRDKCSLMFMDTCVSRLPTGREKGVYYGIDFGGTNVRAVRVELDGKGKLKESCVTINIRNVPSSQHLTKGLLDKEASASLLFNAIADVVKKLMESHSDLEKYKAVDSSSDDEAALRRDPLQIGFTVSFAIDQKRIDSAVLTGWAKGFETGEATKDPVIGRDVCALLDVALAKQKIPAVTVAALNDTTGTLLSAAYTKPSKFPPCLIGLILGTGLNICYCQPHSKDFGYTGTVINTEIGGFDRELPVNIIDIEVDYASTNRGRQRLEKMISGLYLPELCRRAVLKVFHEEAPKTAWIHDSLTGAACAAIATDDDPTEMYQETQQVLEALWDWKLEDQDKLSKIRKLFFAIFERSAALAAMAIAAAATQTGRLQPAMGGLTIGVDGSLYRKNLFYQKLIRHYLEEILDSDTASLIHFVEASDGSGKGAAILASTVIPSLQHAPSLNTKSSMEFFHRQTETLS